MDPDHLASNDQCRCWSGFNLDTGGLLERIFQKRCFWKISADVKNLQRVCKQKVLNYPFCILRVFLSNFVGPTWPEVIKLFSCSTQLSTKFQLLIKTILLTNEEVSCFKSLRCWFYHANACWNANSCWHFRIYEQDKFLALLSWKKFYNLRAWSGIKFFDTLIIFLKEFFFNFEFEKISSQQKITKNSLHKIFTHFYERESLCHL